MSKQDCCDSRKHLVELASELFRGKDISSSQMQSNEWISKKGIRQIVEMRKQERLARQTLRVLQEIRSKSTVKDIEDSYRLIEESPSIKTIREIANYKINIILQAQIFEDILKNREDNLKTKFVSMVSTIFKIAKKQVKDMQPISTNFPTFLSIIASLSFFQALKQESQKIQIQNFSREIQRLNKILEGWRQRVKQCEEENEYLRSQINKNKSKQVILQDQDFQSNYEFEVISKPKLSVYKIKGLEEMSLSISLKKEQQSIACSSIAPFQEKLFVDQQISTISQECLDSQSQTDNFEELIAEYVRPLEKAVNQKKQQALQWKSRLQDTTENLNNAQIQLSNIKQMYRPQTLFQGQIFEGNEKEKKILIQHIQQKRGKRINSTRLLYRYDPLNKVNFHEYIDGVDGITLIVKSMRGFFFGGYYSGKIETERILNQFGLLISITNDKSYTLAQPDRNKIVRSMTHDPFYAIYGNAELRVKNGQNFIFSNFGIMNSYFKNDNKRLIDFVGEQNKEVKFETYQFYQVRLEE